jgi:hypothetical protein
VFNLKPDKHEPQVTTPAMRSQYMRSPQVVVALVAAVCLLPASTSFADKETGNTANPGAPPPARTVKQVSLVTYLLPVPKRQKERCAEQASKVKTVEKTSDGLKNGLKDGLGFDQFTLNLSKEQDRDIYLQRVADKYGDPKRRRRDFRSSRAMY